MAGKRENFSEWYNEVIENAGLIDKRYPIKGMDVWMPYGMEVRNLLDGLIRGEMRRTKHKEYTFPLLIPKNEFQKEADHIEGFDAQVFWVTHGGRNELDVPLVVRPTSETAMYPMFSLWVRSHADLPLKTYQIVNVFRYETKQTRSFIRVREIHFFESHTCHVDYEDAERQIMEDLAILGNLSDWLCMPFTLCKRPEWDKFAGAFYTIGADVLMPEMRTLQLASVHHYKDNFAKPYDIKYEKGEGEFVHVHQTTYGMSERIVGALVGVHGDDQGLRLPPAVAPIQAVVVPILFKDKEGPVLGACSALAERLEGPFRVHVDERDETAGFKFNDWEMRGVPLRIEVGPRDLENDAAVLVPRDGRDDDVEVTSEMGKVLKASKVVVPLEKLEEAITEQLDAYAGRLRAKADALLRENWSTVKTVDDAKAGKGILQTWWCGDEACAETLETEADKTVMGFPRKVEGGAIVPSHDEPGACVVCSKATDQVILMCKSY